MNDDFTTEALAYLLDDLDADRRSAFEARLARDAAAAASFKTCADALAVFALEGAPGEALTPEHQQAMLAAVLAATPVPRQTPEVFVPRVSRWRAVLWPAAAVLLLGLNVGQWAWNRGLPQGWGARWLHSARHADGGPGMGVRGLLQPIPIDRRANGLGDTTLPVAAPNIAAELDRLEALRREFQTLQTKKVALAREYQQMMSQLVAAGGTAAGSGRLVAMELVDASSYAQGKRNGLLDLAKNILTAPGVVAVGPASASASNSASTVESSVVGTPANAANAPVSSAIMTLSAADASLSGLTGSPVVAGSGAAGTTTGSGSAGSSSSETPPAAANSPYAWSVYDDTAGQGYLNLYGLPSVPSGSVLELWVQPTGTDSYEAVGQVPEQFYGQSGSLYYKLPTGTATPAQILITVEPANGTSATPSGPVVLRGP